MSAQPSGSSESAASASPPPDPASSLRALLQLAVPIVAANMLQTVFQLIDTFWLGRLGAVAVAAVSLSFPILFLMISLGGGLTVAGTILVAQFYGSGDRERVDHIAAQTLIALLGVSATIAAAGYLLTGPLVAFFAPEPEVAAPAGDYLRISFLGLVFLFAYFVFQSLLRGIGEVRTPLVIVFGAVILNFLADPLFILGWGPIPPMGVAGAALATIASQGVAGVVGIALLFSGRFGVHVRRRDLRPDWPLIGRILRLGIPASVEQSTRAIGLSVMMLLVTGFGTTVVASYGIGARFFGFVIIPALGLSLATSTLVGQNMGAGLPDRADETTRLAARIGFLALTVAGLLLFAFAVPLTRLFIPESPEVVEMGATFLRIMAPTYGFVAIQQVLTGAFRGAGRTTMAMVLTIVTLWVLQFPLAFVLSERTPLEEAGIWWAFPITNVVAAVIAWLWFRRGTWKSRALTEEMALEDAITREALIDEGVTGG